MTLYQEFFTVIRHLEQHRIGFAIVGGIAMAFHDTPRFTRDIDVLVAEDSIETVRALFESLGYFESSDPWTFVKTNVTLHRFAKIEGEDCVVVDLLAGREPRHRAIIARAMDAPWQDGTVKVARKEDLIWMKQIRNSEQDRVDIKRLRDDQN